MDIWDEKKIVKKSFLQTSREGKKKEHQLEKRLHIGVTQKIKRIRKYSSTLVKKNYKNTC